MPTIVFDVEGLNQILMGMESIQQAAEAEARDSLEFALTTIRQAVQVRTPVNFGHLRGSIDYDIYGKGVSLTGVVATPLMYGYYVEYGRRPGRMPPVTEAIELWARRKGIRFPGKTLHQTAFIIARAIARKGTKGHHMFRDGFKAVEDKVRAFMRGLPERILKRAGGGR